MTHGMLGAIEERVREDPTGRALLDQSSTWSWADVADELGRAAGGMRAVPGRWGVFGDNAGPTLIAHVAGLLAATGTVALSRQLTRAEIVQQGQDADVVGLVAGPASAAAAVAAAAELGVPVVVHGAPADLPCGVTTWNGWLAAQAPLTQVPAGPPVPMMVYTSGTTGRARGTEVKWVTGKPESAVEYLKCLRSKAHLPHGPHLVVGPLQHNGPLAAVRHLLGGQPVLVAGRFDAAGVLGMIERDRVTSTVMVPTHFQRLLALDEDVRGAVDVSSLRMVAHTGASCPEQVKRAMLDWFGPVLVESYGGSEVGTLCRIGAVDWLAHPNSVGRPVEPFEVVVLDAEGAPVPVGRPGRLGFRAPDDRGISYHGDPEKTAAAYLAPGVFTLGDIGFVDTEGFVHVTDRESDMVVSGGVNLYPSEAETVLLEHPEVADIAVVGIPEPDMGEQLLALVVPRDPQDPPAPEELERFCRDGLAAYKVPRRYQFVAELPRNEMQKVDKRRLRRPYWDSDRTIAG